MGDNKTNAAGSRPPAATALTVCALLGLICIVVLSDSRPSEFIIGVALGILFVCILPWLVFLRRRVWSRRFSSGGGWMRLVAILLWLSFLIGPVVTAAFWVSTRFSEGTDGMARFSDGIGLVVFGVVSFSAAFWIAGVALMIQLWRDQWHPRMSTALVLFLLLVFIIYCRTMA